MELQTLYENKDLNNRLTVLQFILLQKIYDLYNKNSILILSHSHDHTVAN